MQKHIVEGLSPISMAEAAIQAMVKAAAYLSENHDMRIAVLEMAAVRGRGYRVVLEITLIPLSTGDTAGRDSKDVEPKLIAAAKERERRQATDTGIKRRIMEHFRKRKGTFMDTASIHLAQLTEGMLMGQIETEFAQKAQPVSSGPVNDPLAVAKAAPAKPAEDHIDRDFQQATRPDEPEPPPKRTGPHFDPE